MSGPDVTPFAAASHDRSQDAGEPPLANGAALSVDGQDEPGSGRCVAWTYSPVGCPSDRTALAEKRLVAQPR